MRYATPMIHFRRTATRDTEIRGVPIRAGERVAIWYARRTSTRRCSRIRSGSMSAASRTRDVAFGRGGPHYCLGAFLARLEIRVLLEEMIARGIRIELTGPPVRLLSNFINGFKSLPVRVVNAR